MNKSCFHNPNTTPPREILPLLQKVKDTYKIWVPIHRDMPRTERFGIGTRLDSTFLEVLEALRRATYIKKEEKIPFLEYAINKTDSLQFFLQLAWEIKLIPNEKYIQLAKEIEEIGRMVGGWRKGIQKKTSAYTTEERNT